MVYHHFSSDENNLIWGHELDYSLSRSFGPKLNVLLKGAKFTSDYVHPDVTKFWLQTVYTY